MRITQNYTDRMYLKRNNNMLTNYNKSMEKLYTQKDYLRASENSINASKAMTVRKNLRDLDTYDANLNSCKELFSGAEDNLYTLANTVYINAQTEIEKACNGTYDKDVDLQTIATAIEQYAEESMELLNSDYAERNLFGGTNNGTIPFSTVTDVDGRKLVTYNNVIIDDIQKENGKYYYQERITKDEYDAAVAADPDSASKKAVLTDLSGEEMCTLLEETDPGKVFTEKGTSGNNLYYTKTVIDEADKDLYDQSSIGVNYNSDGSKDYYVKNYITEEDMYNMLKASDPEGYTSETDINGNVTYSRQQYVYYSADKKVVPGTSAIYVDIGIGIKFDEDYNVDPQTALDTALNGAEITGFGTDEKNGVTYSQNFVQLLYDTADALRNGDTTFANAALDRLSTARTGILTEITTLGAKQNSMDFYIDKNDEYRTSLKSRQNDVEGCDMTEEITNMESTEAAYNAILQLSANVIPKSIFDFI